MNAYTYPKIKYWKSILRAQLFGAKVCSQGEHLPLMSLINEVVLQEMSCQLLTHLNQGGTTGGWGPAFSNGPWPQLARSPISVWSVRVIMYYVSVKLLIHFRHGSTSTAAESIQLRGFGIVPTATTLHQESQTKGVWRLLFGNTCTPWEVSGSVNGLWIAPIETYFHCELGVPAKLQMENDFLESKQ